MAIRAGQTQAAVQRGVISGADIRPAIVLLERDRVANAGNSLYRGGPPAASQPIEVFPRASVAS